MRVFAVGERVSEYQGNPSLFRDSFKWRSKALVWGTVFSVNRPSLKSRWNGNGSEMNLTWRGIFCLPGQPTCNTYLPMNKVLSNLELQFIQREIEVINERFVNLDSCRTYEADIIDRDSEALDGYIRKLEKHYRWAKINESGLQLIESPSA